MTGERSLRIVIDGSMARGGGGFTYLINVIPALVQLAPDHQFLLLVHHPELVDRLPDAPNLEVQPVPDIGFVGRIRWVLWTGPRWARDWRADVFFSVAEYAPLRATCDVIAAFRNRAIFTPIEAGWPLKQRLRLGILKTLARATARVASRVVFVSHDSAADIGATIDLPERKRRVVHHGIDPVMWSQDAGRPTQLDRYILSVGSIYRYKNYLALIEGWAALCRRRPETPDLVIVGDDQDAEYSAEMEEERRALGELGERLHILGEVRYAEVVAWYRHADVFVFPSYLETFGHPLLEAMASDTPLVASDIPVFREIAGDAAYYADPNAGGAFGYEIGRILDSDDARTALVEAGRRRLTEFSWENTARGLLEVFNEASTDRRSA